MSPSTATTAPIGTSPRAAARPASASAASISSSCIATGALNRRRPKPYCTYADTGREYTPGMETQELIELGEHGREAFQRRIGVTMAVFAAMLAVATMMGHRLHTEEVVLQTKLADQWAYYQAKNTRSQMYAN